MAHRRAALGALALAAAATVASAATTTADLIGAYEKVNASVFLDDAHCPSTLRSSTFAFEQFADDAFAGFDYFNIKISHRNLKIGASQCTSSGAIWAIEASHPAVTSKAKMLRDVRVCAPTRAPRPAPLRERLY
jgi:hypothetical protein